MMAIRPIILFLCALGAAVPAWSAPSALIIRGSGGDEDYRRLFDGWESRLRKALSEQLDFESSRIFVCTENADAPTSQSLPARIEHIRQAFDRLAAAHPPEADLYVFLFGHGSYLRGVTRFHIPGPDLEAEELGRLLERAPARRQIVLAASSASAGFVNALSGPNRVVCAATKSVEEKNATEFMEFFLQAIEEGSADRNRDERVSMLEACRQAATLTDARYAAEGLIATEHAILDDNGDGLGTRLHDPESLMEAEDSAASARDGALADACFLKDFSFPDGVPREWIDRYLARLDRIEALKRQKNEMDENAYYAELEAALLEAARANRRIREWIAENTVSAAR